MARELEFGIRITADGKVLVAEAGRAEKAVGSIGKAVEDVNRNTGALTASFARMGHVAATAFSAREVIQAADAFSTLNARLALVSAGATSAAVAYQRVYEIAQATRQGINEVGLIYERFGRQADALGLSQQKLAAITTSVSQAMVISGSSAESSRAALVQLGQGIASGTLRGEELNSVLEQAPRLAQALADGLGVPIGKLRELGETGQLTAEKLVEALTKSAPALAAESARMPVTIAEALTKISNAWVDTVGSFEKSTGVFRVVAGGLQGVAAHMDAVVVAGGTLAAVMTGRLVGAGAAAVGSLAAQAAAAMTAKVQYDALGMAIGAASGRAALAGAAVGALGGPIGIVTTALTLGATAWALWGDSAKNASDKARDALRAAQERAASEGRELVEILRERERAAKAAYDASPRDADGMRDIAGPQGQEWTLSQELLMNEERKLANLEERHRKAAAAIGDTWRELHQTKAQQQDAEIAKLDQRYAAEAAKHAGSAEMQLRLAQEYYQKLGVIQARFKDKSRRDEGGYTDAAAEQAKAYAQQAEAAIKLARGIEIEAEAGGKLLPVEQALAIARTTLTEAQAQEIEKLLAGALLIEQRTAAEKEAAEAAKIHADYVRENLDPLDRQIEALEREAEFYGMTEGAIQRVLVARLEEARALAAENGAWPQHLAYLDVEIEKRQRLAAAADSKGARDANKGALEEMERESQRAFEQIGQSLTDEIMRGGKSAGDLLENYFRTLVLRPIIQGTVNIGMNSVGSLLGMGGSSAAGSGGNLLSTGSSLWSAYSGGTTAMAGSLATNLGFTEIGAGIKLAGTGLGEAAGGMYALGESLGTALPWIGGAIAVASMLGAFDESTPKSGGDAAYGYTDGTRTLLPDSRSSGTSLYGPSSANDQMATALDATLFTFEQQIAALGGTMADVSVGIGYDTDPDGTANSRAAYMFDGEKVGGYDGGRSEEELQAALAAATNDLLARVFDAAEFDADTEALAGTLLNDLKLPVDQVIAAIAPLKSVFDTLSLPIEAFTADLVAAFGGLDRLTASMGSYYQTYYDDAERNEILARQLSEQFKTLNLAMPETKDEFRALVESLDLTTDAGSSTYAALLNLAPAFGQVADASRAAEDAAAALAAQTAATFADWQSQLDVLTGARTQGAIDLEHDLASTTDEATQALIRQVSAANTVTIYLNNPSAASQTIATGTWAIAVLKGA